MLALWLVDAAEACGGYVLVDHRTETKLTVHASSIHRPGAHRWLTLRADDPTDVWVDDAAGERVLDIAPDGSVLHRGARIGAVRGDEVVLGERVHTLRVTADGPGAHSPRESLRVEVHTGGALVISGRAEPWGCFEPRTATDDRADVLQRVVLLLAWSDGVAAAEARR